MRRSLGLMTLVLLGGCAGYAADYWKPKNKLIAAQLVRYQMTGEQGQCVEKKLTDSLSVWQLRQLGDLAKRLVPGGGNPNALGPQEFLYIAGLVEDPEVGPAARAALETCGVAGAGTIAPAAAPAAAAPASTPPSSPASPASPPAAEAAQPGPGPLWVNLGAARTGQGIAVDAASVTRGPSWRQAWFRLLNSDQAGTGDIGYLLRIDCPARTITAHSGRKYAPGGALVEEKAYPSPEGPMGIEPGTVIEVAYHALCDDPR